MKSSTLIFKITLIFTCWMYSSPFCLAMPIFKPAPVIQNKLIFTSDNPTFTNKNLSVKEISKMLDFYTDVFSSETQLSKWYSSVYDSSALLYVPMQYAYDTQNNEKSQNVNWDASHFSRMSAYLHLLKLNFQNDKIKYSYLERLTTLLSNQLITKIAVYNSKNDFYTFNNYIDGNNSSFRSDVKDGKKGIQPSQNFEHIFIGWWKMLNTREVNIMYERIAGKFPYYSEQSAYITHDKGFFQEIVNLK